MKIDNQAISNEFTSDEYAKLHEELVENKKTSGQVQNEALANYTLLNLQRSKRVLKQLKLDKETLNKIAQIPNQNWILITETWCGDAAQSVPIISYFEKINPNIRLQVILRDENLEIMDNFLTNGGRSIPVLVRINPETNEVVSHWGPRPRGAQELFLKHKSEGKSKEESVLEIQKWYNENKSQDLISELIEFAR